MKAIWFSKDSQNFTIRWLHFIKFSFYLGEKKKNQKTKF